MATYEVNPREREAGFGLVELLTTMAVFLVGLLGMMSVFLTTTRISDDNRWVIVADAASRNATETLTSYAFSSVAEEFGPTSGRDRFWFRESGEILFVDPGDAVGTGSIDIYDSESSLPAEFGDLSGAYDLNGNGSIDGTVTDYQVLPVRIRVQIDLANGPLLVESALLLSSW